MPDVVNAAVRSRMMSGIRSKNTKPELIIRTLLHRRGFRFRLHDTKLPGKPDIALPRYRTVVLVNGCFWHGHDCSLFKWPGTRVDWWKSKIERNKANDQRAREALLALDWRVAVVWECSLKGRERLNEADLADRLEDWIRDSHDRQIEIRGELHEARNAG